LNTILQSLDIDDLEAATRELEIAILREASDIVERSRIDNEWGDSDIEPGSSSSEDSLLEEITETEHMQLRILSGQDTIMY
jgi:hypothetical protein